MCGPIGKDDYECECGKGYVFSSGSCILVRKSVYLIKLFHDS